MSRSSRTCSVTAPPSSTTCAISGTTSARSSKPGRTSARGWCTITPTLSAVGTGTVVADGLSINNADYSSTSFRVSQTTIGPHNFLGNNIAYPSRGKTGDNCLLGTKVMVPIDGKVREGVGLLGSPSFEIPRSVLRDTRLDLESTERRRRLTLKNWHNLGTVGLGPAGAVDAFVRPHHAGHARRGPLPSLRDRRDRCGVLRPSRCSRWRTSSSWNAPRRAFGRCAPSTARSTIPTSGGTNVSGSSQFRGWRGYSPAHH